MAAFHLQTPDNQTFLIREINITNKYSTTTKALTWSEGKSVVAQLTKLFLRIPDQKLD